MIVNRFALSLLLAFITAPAFAQLVPSGSPPSPALTPGHTLRILSPLGKNGAVVGDGGGAGGTATQGQGTLTEIGITNTGTPFCIHTTLITGADAPLCFGHDTNNNPIFTSNGISFPLGGGSGGGNVTGPNPTTTNDISLFGNGLGTLLKDGGAANGVIGGISIPSPLQTLSVLPTGNPISSTLGSLIVQGNAVSQNSREFLFQCGFTSAVGNNGTAGNDKVCGFFGAVGNPGSSNLWAMNTLANANTGFFVQGGNNHVLHNMEVDLNNEDQDVLTATTNPAALLSPYSVGIGISGNAGASDHINTAAIAIGDGKFQYGVMSLGHVSQAGFYENSAAKIGIDIEKTAPGTGIAVNLGGLPAIAGLVDLRSGTNNRLVMRGPQDLGSGLAISSLNDAGGAFVPLEIQAGQLLISQGPLRLLATTFANAGTCNAGFQGGQAVITDSTTATWGATISGGGSSFVLAFCDGANWTVAAK